MLIILSRTLGNLLTYKQYISLKFLLLGTNMSASGRQALVTAMDTLGVGVEQSRQQLAPQFLKIPSVMKHFTSFKSISQIRSK